MTPEPVGINELPPIIAPPVDSPAKVIRPRVWPVFVAYVVAILVGLFAGTVVIFSIALLKGVHPLTQENLQAITTSVPGLLGTLLATMAVVGGVALSGAISSKTPWRERLRLRKPVCSPLIYVVSSFGALAVAMVVIALDGLDLIPHSPVLEMMDDFVRQLSPGMLIVTTVVIGVLPGLCEEALFRGYIQTRLSQRWGMWPAIICTAIMFGVMHFDLVQGSFAAVLGVFLGYVVERTGSLLPAMAGHAFNNSVNTILSASEVPTPGHHGQVALLVGGLLTIAVCCVCVARLCPRSVAV